MLNRILHFSVNKLFNSFNYELDLQPECGNLMFLTAPNGYGKTTILSIMYYMLSGRKILAHKHAAFRVSNHHFREW